MGAQPHPGDDAERALRPGEQLVEIGADGAGRAAAGSDHGAVGEHDLEADDHVFDLAVAGRVLTGAATCHPATHRRQVEALREVADGEPVLGPQLRAPDRARTFPRPPRRHPTRRRSRRCPTNAVVSSTTPPWMRHRCPRHAAPTTGRGDRDPAPRCRRRGSPRPAAWSSVGRRRAARHGTIPASDQCSASGHQSRLASATGAMSVTVSQIAASRSSSDGGSGVTSLVQPLAGSRQLDRWCRCRHRRIP